MRLLQAHCYRDIGRRYAATGRWAQVRAALSTAFHLSRAMEMTFWLPQTEAFLMQVEGEPGHGQRSAVTVCPKRSPGHGQRGILIPA